MKKETTAVDMELLNFDDILGIVKITRNQIYKLMKEKKFPKNIKIGSRSFWIKTEIEEYLEDAKKQRFA